MYLIQPHDSPELVCSSKLKGVVGPPCSWWYVGSAGWQTMGRGSVAGVQLPPPPWLGAPCPAGRPRSHTTYFLLSLSYRASSGFSGHSLQTSSWLVVRPTATKFLSRGRTFCMWMHAQNRQLVRSGVPCLDFEFRKDSHCRKCQNKWGYGFYWGRWPLRGVCLYFLCFSKGPVTFLEWMVIYCA